MLLWTPPVPVSRSFSYSPWVSTADISRPEKYQVVVFWGHPPWLVFAQSHCCHLLHNEKTSVCKLFLWWCVDVRKLSLWWCRCQKAIPVMVTLINYPCDGVLLSEKLLLWWSVDVRKLSLWWCVDVRKLSLWWCVDVRKTIPVMACCQKTVPVMVCWCQKTIPVMVCRCQNKTNPRDGFDVRTLSLWRCQQTVSLRWCDDTDKLSLRWC